MLALSGAITAILVLVFGVLSAIVAVANPSEFQGHLFAYSPLVLLVLLLVMAVQTLAMRPWRYVADMAAMQAGAAWVHWTYDEASWRSTSSFGHRKSALSPVQVPSRARRATRGEIYISRRGIYWRPGGYMPLDLKYDIRYESVDLVDRPTPHIHIEVSEVDSVGAGRIRRTLTDVGVPPGHEDEARALVERLRREMLNPSSDSDW